MLISVLSDEMKVLLEQRIEIHEEVLGSFLELTNHSSDLWKQNETPRVNSERRESSTRALETYWYRMRVINEKLDRLPVLPSSSPLPIDSHPIESSRLLRSVLSSFDDGLLVELHVKLDQQKSLISNSREEVELSDEIEDVGTTESKVVWEGLSWLTVENEAGIGKRRRGQLRSATRREGTTKLTARLNTPSGSSLEEIQREHLRRR